VFVLPQIHYGKFLFIQTYIHFTDPKLFIGQLDVKQVTIIQYTDTNKARQITTHTKSNLFNKTYTDIKSHNTISNILNTNHRPKNKNYTL
jgi:hypothetical protein